MGESKGCDEGFWVTYGTSFSLNFGLSFQRYKIEGLIEACSFPPRVVPQTSLASRAIDGLSDPKIKQGVIDELFRYLDTDTTWYALALLSHPEDH